MNFNISIENENMMQTFAAKLSQFAVKGMVIFLHGNLGAGKTTFTRGFLRGLGYEGHVKSPTYTLVESYEFEGITVFHFDFYRLKDPEELAYIGIEDYFTKESICIIEWPESAGAALPVADLDCYFEMDQERRHLNMLAKTEKGKMALGRWNDAI